MNIVFNKYLSGRSNRWARTDLIIDFELDTHIIDYCEGQKIDYVYGWTK